MAGTSGLDVAHIFRLYGDAFRQKHRLCRAQLRAMRAIAECRTAALGGHLYRCDECGVEKNCYNSCRNRHCPKCQGLDKQRWLERRREDLLPVPYFHVVFTLPAELNILALGNPEAIYNLLFHCAAQTLIEIAADPKHLGVRLGVLAVLHTWGQTLGLHPHLHCIVPGGGPSVDGKRWVSASEKFFLPVQVLARVFRGKFLAGLRKLYQEGRLSLSGGAEPLSHPVVFNDLLDRLSRKSWCVYSKPPFGGPEQVLQYLARYTHRVAISNHRLRRLDHDQVTFTYKDYTQGGRTREMTLPAEEFIRRFLLHILPDRFVRIRYYGLFANRHRKRELERCRELLGVEPPPPRSEEREDWQTLYLRVTGKDPTLCEHCGRGHLQWVKELPPLTGGRSPP
jgi:hypothetical protein